MGYDDGTTHAEDVPSFDHWLLVNGRPVELLEGQHRLAALKRLVSKTGAGKQELHSPCNFYDGDTLPRELNRALRMNRRDPTMADSHGGIWVQLAIVASETPGIFHGSVAGIEEQMLRAMQLGGGITFPLPQLVNIWCNDAGGR